jgi:hypothetical protein
MCDNALIAMIVIHNEHDAEGASYRFRRDWVFKGATTVEGMMTLMDCLSCMIRDSHIEW